MMMMMMMMMMIIIIISVQFSMYWVWREETDGRVFLICRFEHVNLTHYPCI